MLFPIYLVAFLLKSSSEFETQVSSDMQNRVYNGYQVTSYEFPFLARLTVYQGSTKFICTGTLISHYYVLTAGHCLLKPASKLMVRLGIDALDEEGLDFTCMGCAIVHSGYDFPRYSPDTLNVIFDIGLVRLPEYVEFSDRIGPVQLPSYNDLNKYWIGEIGTVIGWGETNTHLSARGLEMGKEKGSVIVPHVPLAATAEVLDQDYCSSIFYASNEPYDPLNQFCTTHSKGGSCQGDSGGPFIIRSKQYGIVSGGTTVDLETGEKVHSCAPNYADNYTNITRFLNWIEANSDVRIGQYTNSFPDIKNFQTGSRSKYWL